MKKELTGKTILVTAGPCREPLDPVRFLSNRSSGKMGYAIAEAAVAMGARTILISGPTSLKPPDGVEYVGIETTAQMYDAVASAFDSCDSLIMAAAPADYAPDAVAGEKIKKADAGMQLALRPTVDILKSMGERKKERQVLVGFALETENGVANARKKLKEKNLDIVVLNNPRDEGAGFDHDTNRVTVIVPGSKPKTWPLASKQEIAARLVGMVADILHP